MINWMLLTDSYKFSHHKMYPSDMTAMGSYFESRGSKLGYKEVVFFGLQYFLKKYLSKPLTYDDLWEAKALVDAHLGPGIFNEDGFARIVNKHNGLPPVTIRAVPEGSVIPCNNVLMTVESEEEPWVVNFIETLLVQMWYPCTVATISYEMRKLFEHYTDKDVSFMLHDFGFRGASSPETAALGGASHLLSFKGSDTFAAIKLLKDYYKASMPGFSVPATEHSTITSWGKSNEMEAYRNLLDKFPTGTVACVSDSYNIYKACSKMWGGALRDRVLDREGVLVIRPDSGDPKTVCEEVMKILYASFPGGVDTAGRRLLNPKVRLIQGDGMTPNSIEDFLSYMEDKRWSVENFSFGMGGGLLQKVDRDTLKFAFKCSWIKEGAGIRGVYKDPVDDPGKTSKQGNLTLVNTGDRIETRSSLQSYDNMFPDMLRTVYSNGRILIDERFEDIKERLSGA